MANDMTAINDNYNNGLNDLYGEMPRSQNLLTKTGQTTSYNSGDDGESEIGLDLPITRFENDVLDGDDIVIDYHTGLMWARFTDNLSINDTYKTWAAYFPLIAALSFGGFDDWRMPNVHEYMSIIDYKRDGSVSPMYGLYSNFTQTSGYHWCSTTHPRITANAYQYSRTDSIFLGKVKTGTGHSPICRSI